MSFIVPRKFYRSAWFWLAFISFLAIAVFTYLVSRARRVNQQKARLQREVYERTVELREAVKHAESLRIKAEAADRTKTEFLRIAVHDLKNPLSSILGFAQLLQNEDEKDTVREIATFIKSSSSRMIGALDSVVGASEAISDPTKLERQYLDITELSKLVVQQSRSRALLKDQTVSLRHPNEQIIQGDPALLKRALENLLDNAIKFSPHGSKIGLTLDLGDDGATILSVTDQGPGISSGEINRIFTIEGKGDSEPTGGENSSGLGLSSTKQIVEAHGGTISVAPMPEGGSRFTINLPDAEADE